MASAHIEINGSATRLNGRLRGLIEQLQATQEDAARFKAIADQIALGGDFAALGEALALTASEAETVYNLLGSVNTELHGPFTSQFLSRLG